MKRSRLRKGDRSAVGGVIDEGIPRMMHEGTELTFLGARVTCPACHSTGQIVPTGPRWPANFMGKQPALEGDLRRRHWPATGRIHATVRFGGMASTSRPITPTTPRFVTDSSGAHPLTISLMWLRNGAKSLCDGKSGTRRRERSSTAVNAGVTIRCGFRRPRTVAPYSGCTIRII